MGQGKHCLQTVCREGGSAKNCPDRGKQQPASVGGQSKEELPAPCVMQRHELLREDG